MSILQEFKDNFAKELYGMTTADAHRKCICIACQKRMPSLALGKLRGSIEDREYAISGLCDTCFPDYDSEDCNE